MPHEMISQLPDAVKNNLPGHEQEIYTQAFKSAERKYEKNENGNGVEGCRHEALAPRARALDWETDRGRDAGCLLAEIPTR